MRARLILACSVAVLLAPPAGAQASFPGRDGRIAFGASYDDGGDRVEAVSPRDPHVRRLLKRPADMPAYSPDGRRLAYVAGEALVDGGYGDTHVCIVRQSGRGAPICLPKVSDDPVYHPAWSPDGRRIAYVTRPRSDTAVMWHPTLRVFNLLTGRDRRLNDCDWPAWSSRGQLACMDTTGIYVLRRDGLAKRLVARRGAFPDWSPDGRRLVYVSRSSGSIYTRRAARIGGGSCAGARTATSRRPSTPRAGGQWHSCATRARSPSSRWTADHVGSWPGRAGGGPRPRSRGERFRSWRRRPT